jgi:uncharacterized iron-regulated membrane protein
VAVFLFLLLVPLGLSGVVLAWPEQINAPYRASPAAPASERAGLAPSAYFAAARAALPPGARVQALHLPERPGEAVAVSASVGGSGPGGGRTVWLAPADGRLLKVAPAVSPLFSWSHDFHGAFMIRGLGRQLVGWAGVAMLLLSLSGIWLWWPRGPSLLRGFRWRRTPDTLLNLHHLVGFWLSIPLAALSLTGMFIAFPPLASAVLGASPPRPPQADAPRAQSDEAAAVGRAAGGTHGPHGRGDHRAGGGEAQLTAEQAAAAAIAAHPEAPRLIAVTVPGAARGPAAAQHAWRIELGGAAHPVAVLVDDRSAAVSAAPARRRPGGALGLNREIHEGGGSLIWKLIVSLAGVAPAVLALTGLITWLKAQARKARLQRAAQPA